MRKIGKKKAGFTLVEMVLVIAILVILAGVLVIGIGSYLNRATKTASSVKAHNSSIEYLASKIDEHVNW